MAKLGFQQFRRHFLLQAHDTETWASYLPRVPWLAWPPAILGVGLIGYAFTLASLSPEWARVTFTAVGLLLCLPLVGAAGIVWWLRTRRAAVRQQMLDAVSWRGDEQVLDVGCGSGMLLNGAAARLPQGKALGIDIWADHGGGGSFELLWQHAWKEGVAERIDFQEVDARQMPFADTSFDVVLSSWALHHISRSREDFENVVQEMLRVLRPGGTMVVVDVRHMVEVLATRMEHAGLEVTLADAAAGQSLVVGKKTLTM